MLDPLLIHSEELGQCPVVGSSTSADAEGHPVALS